MAMIMKQKKRNSKLPSAVITRRRLRRRAAPSSAGRFKLVRAVRKQHTWGEKFKVKVVVLKREMEELGKDQEVVAMQQMEMRKKIDDIRVKCAEIRQETEDIIKRQASNHHLLLLIFNVLRARNNGDSAK